MASFSLLSLTVYPYGLAVALAAVAGLFAAGFTIRRAGLKAGSLSWFALLALPLCALCARLGYCLVRFGWFTQKGFDWFFRFSEGGFILYGALLGGFLAAALTARLTRQSVARIADAVSAPAMLTIALCRLAEGLVDEGYGRDLEMWFTEEGYSLFRLEDAEPLFFFPLGHYWEEWDTWYLAVYVLAAAIGLIIFFILLRTRPRRDGDRAAAFLLLYAAMQALLESMREDSVLRWGFVRVSQILSAVVIAGVLFYWCRRAPKGSGGRILRAWLLTLLSFGVIIAMEFGVEKKIVALEWLPVAGCHIVMFLACLAIIAIVLSMRDGKKVR